MDEAHKELSDAIEALTDHTTDLNRPFTGQPQTENGERGKTEIKGIRFRDLADCLVRAFVNAAALDLKDEKLTQELYRRAKDGTLNYNDLYKLDLSKMDPMSLIQNVNCEVEKMMGIFPNVPKLHYKSKPPE